MRTAENRILAYQMTVEGSVSLLTQMLVTFSRTAILLGILLALDIALLFLMLYKDHSWHLDFKWVVIFAIVDFMLVFQVLPMVYLIVKAFFPDGSFTFHVFERLYTYSMNLGALKNTLIAATATMILGTLRGLPVGLAGGSYQPVRQKVLPLAVCAHLHGAALCGRHGVAAPAQPQRGHAEPVLPPDL